MRRGVTLVELIVALAILGVLSGLAAATLGGLRSAAPDARTRALTAARERAVRTGRRVRINAPTGEALLFMPDGRVVGDGVDPLTGLPDATR